ncbi:MAG: penicillin acylase family protein [Candidatus Eremiobacteraeota bacterium]|nr:penicillin acylase family protein [Candidatus Eremiobacteraeota bacterium]
MAFSLRRGRTAVFKAAALIVLVLLVIVAAILAWLVRSPLPKVNGTVTVSGIHAAVTIRRDMRGIPHIDASDEADLFFGQGFACAQDRLWQMDLLRRTAEGGLSEVVGPAALNIDRYMRKVGLGAAARHDADALRGQARIDVEAYAAGVNAAASSHPLPLEFRLLQYRPEPWVPADSIAIIKLMAQRLDDQWGQVELRALLQKKVGLRAANALMNAQVPGLESFIASPAPGVTSSEKPASQVADATALTTMLPLPPDPQSGSNNWVVAGSRVTTGKPVLSNDTHLGHSVPSTYWLAHLRGAGYDVAGFIIPGIPFIALGHNDHIAFGVTSGDLAVQDIFIERFRSPHSDEYIANGRWVRAQHRVERINVKGGPAQVLDVLVTRHGPLLARSGTKANALAWTILRGGNEVELLRRLDRAANWSQFEDALSQVVGPVFNWVYADVNGNIGYHLAAKVPKRTHGDGSLPVEGEDGRYDWHGYLPFDSLPHAYNPRGGFLATANNQLAPSNTVIGSSPFFDAPFRVHEIRKRLERRVTLTPQEVGDIQTDIYDLPRAQLARITARELRASQDRRLRLIGTQLEGWDGLATVTSSAPTFLVAETRALEDMLVTPKISSKLADRYDADFNVLVPFGRVLNANDKSLESMGITRRSLLAAIPTACSRAADATGATAASGIARITPWGRQNDAIYSHPVGRSWPLDALFNIKQFPQPGDGFTVYASKPDHGPASRMVADLSNWDNSAMSLTLGESGHFNDAHYQDQVEDFANVKWVRMPFSDAAVRAATKDTLTLNP